MTEQELIDHWRKDADGYGAQVAEACAQGKPHERMLGWQQALRMCANDLEKLTEKKPVRKESTAEGELKAFEIISSKFNPYKSKN